MTDEQLAELVATSVAAAVAPLQTELLSMRVAQLEKEKKAAKDQEAEKKKQDDGVPEHLIKYFRQGTDKDAQPF